jgi:hypothetical protein
MRIEAVEPRLFRAAWKAASISRSASSEGSTPRFIRLAAKGWMFRSITSPPISRLSEKARILQAAGALRQKGLLDRAA